MDFPSAERKGNRTCRPGTAALHPPLERLCNRVSCPAPWVGRVNRAAEFDVDRLVSPRGRDNQPPVPTPTPAGQVYLDVTRRRLHCLNDRARQMLAQGVPFTPADLERSRLRKPDGSAV